MMSTRIRNALQLRSLVKSTGELELSLVEIPVPEPMPEEVVIRVEAAPLNPSDLGNLFAGADLGSARFAGSGTRRVVTAPISPGALKALAGRVDVSSPVGNEGAGLVVEAGSSPEAQALLGRTVAALGGGMYAQARCVPVAQCLLLPEGTTAAEGASAFVNPLTALGMVETMRREGHTALVHTAAASNLGQMLNRLCIQDGIGLVNIVRKPEQVKLLAGLGAVHVYNSTAPGFMQDLTDALATTRATLAFDATGGGKLAGQILTAMEAALSRKATVYSPYGTSVHKQVYLYGGLERGPTELNRNFGMAWGIGGWLVRPFLQKAGPETAQRLKARVAAGLKTTFASNYSREISLAEVLAPDAVALYGTQATGAKVLINPSKGVDAT
jgi:NADPH2:quinone reductase